MLIYQTVNDGFSRKQRLVTGGSWGTISGLMGITALVFQRAIDVENPWTKTISDKNLQVVDSPYLFEYLQDIALS